MGRFYPFGEGHPHESEQNEREPWKPALPPSDEEVAKEDPKIVDLKGGKRGSVAGAEEQGLEVEDPVDDMVERLRDTLR